MADAAATPKPKKPRKQRSDKGKKRGPRKAKPTAPSAAPSPAPTPVAERAASVGILVDPVSTMRRMYRNFADFLAPVWRAAIPGSPEPTALQKEMADYLQNGPSRKMILGFRGVAKSYIGAAWIDFEYFHDEEQRVKYLSGSEDKVGEFSDWAKSLLINDGLPFLHFLHPEKGSRDSRFSWDVAPASRQQSPSFSGSPVMSAIQGGRCTIAMADDAEQKSNTQSELMRERILKHTMDMSAMLLPDKKQHFVVLGNYQVLASIYDRMIKERGFDVMYIPARVPKKVADYEGKLAPSIAKRAEDPAQVGEPTETRFSDIKLKVYEREAGPLQWQLEWMVSSKHGDRYEHPFALERLIVWDGVNPHGAPMRIVPGSSKEHRIHDIPFCGLPGDCFFGPSYVDDSNMIPYGTILMAIDPSGSSGKDECAYAILGAVQGQVHLLETGGFVNGVDPKTLKRLANIAKVNKVREIVYESNLQAWGSLFESALQDAGHHVRVEAERAVKSKTERILVLEPVLYGGQMIASRKALEQEFARGSRDSGTDPRWQERLLQYQLAMFRRNDKNGGIAFDDRIDALALGVKFIHERFLKTSADAAAEQLREEMAAERFGDWQDAVWGEGTREELAWVKVR